MSGNRRNQNRRSPAKHGQSGRSPNKGGRGRDEFARYEDYRQVMNDIHAGRVFAGRCRINPFRRSEMFVPVEGLGFDVIVEDQDENRALEGDIVAVRIHPEDKWTGQRSLPSQEAAAASSEADRAAAAAAAELAAAGGSDDTSAAASEPSMWLQRVDTEGWAEGGRTLPLEAETEEAEEAEEEVPYHTPADAQALMRGPPTGADDPRAVALEEARAAADGNEGTVPRASEHALAAAAALAERAETVGKRPTGKVVRILEEVHTRSCTGNFRLPKGHVAGRPFESHIRFLFFEAMDRRLPWLRIQLADVPEAVVRDPVKMAHDLYTAHIVQWSERSKNPLGKVSAHLGRSGDVEVETQLLLRENGVAHPPFSDAVEASLAPFRAGVVPVNDDGTPCTAEEAEARAEAAGGIDNIPTAWTIPDEERATRRDFTGHRVFTIDPTTARDLDDALHVRRVGGEIEMGVHIADVTYFVRPDTPLDVEANRRATTVYLVQKAIPMLPRLLSNNLCSLNPNVERLAYSCVWRMKPNGEMSKKKPWFGRSIIRSCCKLDYNTAQRIIDGTISKEDADQEAVAPELWEPDRHPTGGHRMAEVYRDVMLMHNLAAARRQKRFANGALTINFPKLTFRRDATTGIPYEFSHYVTKEANHLVEEYMLAANYLVAERLLQTAGALSFIRNHEPPNQIGKVATALQQRGINVDVSSAGKLNDTLRLIRDLCVKSRSDPSLRQQLATRWRVRPSAVPFVFGGVTQLLGAPLKRANYIAVGEKEPLEWRHYGLNMPYYTHFTSPIRRYADVMVHRMLTACLETSHESPGAPLDSYYLSLNDLEKVAETCNTMKDSSKKAQDRSDLVFLCLFLHDHPQETTAVVTETNGDKFCKVYIESLGITEQIFYDRSGFDAAYDKEEDVATVQWLSNGPTRTEAGDIIVDHGIEDSEDDDEDGAVAAAGAGAAPVAGVGNYDAAGRYTQPFKLRSLDAVHVRVTATNTVPMKVIALLRSPVLD